MNQLNILSESFKKIKNYLDNTSDTNQPIVKFKNPSELKEVIDFKVGNKGVSENEFWTKICSLDSLKKSNVCCVRTLNAANHSPIIIGRAMET